MHIATVLWPVSRRPKLGFSRGGAYRLRTSYFGIDRKGMQLETVHYGAARVTTILEVLLFPLCPGQDGPGFCFKGDRALVSGERADRVTLGLHLACPS